MIVIGAGVAGIYQIKRLVDLGIKATVLEAAGGLGGTWYGNRYPGARFDSESYTYGYSFSREVLEEWHWKEKFSGQPENLRYLNHVVAKFDLRRHIRFNTRVTSAVWDNESSTWQVTAQDGYTARARYLVGATGVLSAPFYPNVPGRESFRGESYHHTLMTPFFNPGPNPYGVAKIILAAVGERMTEVAGEVADGIILHGFTTERYVR